MDLFIYDRDINENGLIKQEILDKNFDKITYVNVSRTKIKELPLWPNVIHVMCSHCPNLKELPLWHNVKLVRCADILLEELPLWPNVEKVDCDECMFTSFPPWPKIQRVWCAACPQLKLPLWPDVEFICEPEKIESMYKKLHKMQMLLLSEYKDKYIKEDLLGVIGSYSKNYKYQ